MMLYYVVLVDIILYYIILYHIILYYKGGPVKGGFVIRAFSLAHSQSVGLRRDLPTFATMKRCLINQ